MFGGYRVKIEEFVAVDLPTIKESTTLSVRYTLRDKHNTYQNSQRQTATDTDCRYKQTH